MPMENEFIKLWEERKGKMKKIAILTNWFWVISIFLLILLIVIAITNIFIDIDMLIAKIIISVILWICIFTYIGLRIASERLIRPILKMENMFRFPQKYHINFVNKMSLFILVRRSYLPFSNLSFLNQLDKDLQEMYYGNESNEEANLTLEA